MRAYSGRQENIERVSAVGSMSEAGSQPGSPVAMAASLNALQLLQRSGLYKKLESTVQEVEDELRRVFIQAVTLLRIDRVGLMMTLLFASRNVTG